MQKILERYQPPGRRWLQLWAYMPARHFGNGRAVFRGRRPEFQRDQPHGDSATAAVRQPCLIRDGLRCDDKSPARVGLYERWNTRLNILRFKDFPLGMQGWIASDDGSVFGRSTGCGANLGNSRGARIGMLLRKPVRDHLYRDEDRQPKTKASGRLGPAPMHSQSLFCLRICAVVQQGPHFMRR